MILFPTQGKFPECHSLKKSLNLHRVSSDSEVGSFNRSRWTFGKKEQNPCYGKQETRPSR